MLSFVSEYFSQRDALAQVAAEATSVRMARRDLVLRARQKREAAEAAASVSLAESLRLMRDAVLLLQEAIGEGSAGETFAARCASLGVDATVARRLEAMRGGLAELPLPALESDVGEAEVETYNQLTKAALTLDRALSRKITLQGDLLARRRKRRVVAALVGVATALVLYVEFRPLPCRASAFLFEEFRPEMAIDGVVESEWLLPDGKPGWIDVRVRPSRDIRSVRVINGHNRASMDRAIRAYRLEAYSGRRLVNSVSGEFPALLPAPPPTEIPLVAKDVNRVRLVVVSWFGAGAALAEIKVQ